jgi:hypothetical protein
VSRDSGIPSNAGAYGHIFEALITAQLSASYFENPAQIGTLFIYLSRLAFYLFQKDRFILSEDELSRLHERYNDAFGLRLDRKSILESLLASRILTKQDSTFSFRYKWTYYYFVALYLADRFEKDPVAKAKVYEITDHLSTDEYTNILILFLYKTKNHAVLDRILANAARIYRDESPCDLGKDVGFLNQLTKEAPKPIPLPASTPKENRDAARQATEEIEATEQILLEPAPTERISIDEAVSELMKLMIAFHHLRLMGQVLKNFPGVLEKEPKLRLAEASYLLSLRIMARLLRLVRGDLDNLREYLAKSFREKNPEATTQQIERNADEQLISLTSSACLGLIKRVSRAVGIQDLQPTFEDVLLLHEEKTSVQLIDLAIKLEHFGSTPETQIFELEKGNKKNYFAYKMLLDLVYEHLLLRTTDTRVLQRLGELFGIKTSRPQFLLSKAVASRGR